MTVSTPMSRAGMAALLLLSIGVGVLATLEINSDYISGQEWAPLVAYTSVAWVVCYAVCSWAYFRSLYLFSLSFIVALAVFHLGLLVPYAMGAVDVLGWRGSQGRWTRLAGWYTALAFASFGVGFTFFCLRARVRSGALSSDREIARFGRNIAGLRNLAIGLVLASAISLAIVILKLGNILAYSRFALFFQSGDPRFLSLFFFLAPTAALTLVVTSRKRSERLGSYLFGAVILLLALLSGNRTWALFPLLVGAVLWVKLGGRIPFVVALSTIAGILLLIPTIGMIRTLGTYQQLSLKDFEASQQRSTIASALFEMGSTLNALAVTVEYVPDKQPYRFGLPLYMSLKQAIPNLGLAANLEFSREELYQRLISDPSAELELEPSDWAAWKIIPDTFVAGAGTGFSAVAEPYFSFGYVGVIVWFALLGAFLAKMDLVDVRLHYYWLVFVALFFWHLLAICRNSFGVFTKPSGLTLVVILIWIVVRNFTPFRLRPRSRG